MNPNDKLSKQAEQKHFHRYRGHFDGYHMEGCLGGWVKNVKRLRSTNWLLQNSHEDVKWSRGNTVNNILITTCGVRGTLDLLGWPPSEIYNI